MKRSLFVLLLLLGVAAQSQDLSLFQKRWMVQGGDTMPYRLLLPANYDPMQKYPLVIFLHGSGERGNDNELQLVHGANMFLKEGARKRFPAIVVFPQCSRDGFWSNVARDFDNTQKLNHIFLVDEKPTRDMQLLQTLLHMLLSNYPVKSDQVYLGGLSMGGMGTFELVKREPGIFAAAFPICGGANPATAKSLKSVSWWIFHGAKDDVVFPAFSRQMSSALQKQGAKQKFTLYPDANHNSWDPAFAEPELLPWLFSQKRVE